MACGFIQLIWTALHKPGTPRPDGNHESPSQPKDAEANINQTGNQKANGLFLSKLLRPLIPVYPFSTHCFTCLIEAQVIEIQLAEGDEHPGTEIRTSVSVTHEVTHMETASQDLQKAEGTRPARRLREKSAA